MVRIDIDWKFISPSLAVASGIITIIEKSDVFDGDIIILKCNCRIERGMKSFTAIDEEKGYSSKTFNKYEESIKCMLNSYFDGMTLRKGIYHWVEL